MKMGINEKGSALAAGVLSMMLAVSPVFAKNVNVIKGSGAGSFALGQLSYDGVADADIETYSGKDNVGGSYIGQVAAEWSPTTTACTAPDNSAGVQYDLIQANA